MQSSPSIKNILKIVLGFSKKKKVRLFIVGGILRDILLKRDKDNLDVDFCLNKGAINFGRKLAKEMRAGFVVLDDEHGACRLVKKIGGKPLTLDFTDFRGKDLKEDLLHRDFTINTLAIKLDDVFIGDDLSNFIIDPYRGREDLKAKIISVPSKRVFDEDPLRIMRAFSFACILGFRIDSEALKLIKLKKNKLSNVSFERIRDELFKILDRPNAFNYLEQMDKQRILEIIFPEIKVMRNVRQGPYHHLDIWGHTLDTFWNLEKIIDDFKNNKDIQEYLNEVISSERRRRALIKLGAFLHDIGKPKTLRREGRKIMFYGHERVGMEISQDILKRLKLSNDELDSMRKMVFWHLRPGYLADHKEVTQRAKFRYFRDTAKEAASVLLISLADQRATKGPLTTKESRIAHERVVSSLIKEYFKKKKEKKPLRLINGDDLIRKFKLTPSPLVGKILSEVEELQAIGEVKTKEEAFKVAKRFIK